MKWKSLFKMLLVLPTLVFSTFTTSRACGWSDEWEGAFYRFFEPDYTSLADYKPFHFTFDRLYDYELLDEKTSEAANLAAWSRYLGASVPQDHIKNLVYEADLDILLDIQSLLTSGRALPPDYSTNALVREWKANRRRELLDYLLFAHRAEPFCRFEADDWSEEPRSMAGAEELIQIAQTESKKATDPFLKLRYGYQALRLQQYSEGQTEQAIETYRNLVLPHASADPLIASWAQCHYAGCLRQMELEAEAAYQFSIVFDQCPSRRVQAWYGWRILSDEIWDAVQAKCKTNHEMSVVYFLRAFSPNAISTDDMQQMQELDPGSELIEVLMLREVNKLESNLMGFPYGGDQAMHKRFSKGEASNLLRFVNQVLKSGKMHDRNVWELAAIYLQFLDGDFQGASTALAAKQPSLTGDGALKGRLMDLVFRIASAKSVDRNLENAIFKDFTNLSAKMKETESDELRNFRDDALAWLYEAQGEPAKAMLARNRTYELTNFPIDMDLVNGMIAFNSREDKTLYERELQKRLVPDGIANDYLLDIKGTGLLGRNLLPEAIRVFEQISSSYQADDRFQLDADPFRLVITDVVHCEDCGKGKYNKLTYAQKVLDLQKQVLSDPSKAVEYNMLLGNAYYASTYFGAAWRAKDYYRSGGSWYSLGENNEYFKFDVATFDENVDMTMAKEYYTKALNGAKDKEMGALAAFMVAKCELNQFYMAGYQEMANFRKGFSKLQESYRKTDVYKDLIDECLDFRAYVR